MYQHIKRLIDIVLSLGAIVVLSPVLLLLAVLIKLDSKGPVLFKQKRVGKGKTHFEILKFRTMYADVPKDVPTHLLADPESKITKIGRFLRKSSLDELPQIWNILVGEMSIIGPRPLLVHYLPLYNEEQRHRHDVRPGLTGWAQANGRNTVSWENKFKYDVEYVENISFSMDMKILFMTIKSVIKRDGISSETSATMEQFTGNKEEG
jgi:lipopolysaccharide/colanic/teichoic acid biosynthesis glycosyltransferase